MLRRVLLIMVACVSVGLALGAAACGKETVIPFAQGEPCSAAATMQIDCAEFYNQTCVVPGPSCPRTIYGCADGGYFEQQDDSQCPMDAEELDASLIGNLEGSADADATDGVDAGQAGDARGE